MSTTTYTVTFNSQGGSTVDSLTVVDGGLVTEPTVPTKTGYTFGGWYKESGCTNTWVFNTDTVTADVTLYAKWTTANSTYTVTYSGNGSTGGTVPVDSSSPYEYGAPVTILDKGDLVKMQDGISLLFEGWNIADDGSGNGGTDYNAGDTFNMGSTNVILYAQWSVLRGTGPAGGLIFYDKGSYSDGWRYLEAAPASTEGGTQWSSYGAFIGETATGIGTGQSNTNIIVKWLNSHGETNRAAQFCDDLVVASDWAFLPKFDDWFLPSKDELNLMYQNLKVAGVGGFTDYYYWSSSEANASYAFAQHFANASQYWYYKDHTYLVRAVRAF